MRLALHLTSLPYYLVVGSLISHHPSLPTKATVLTIISALGENS
jgi:hypothetical protein